MIIVFYFQFCIKPRNLILINTYSIISETHEYQMIPTRKGNHLLMVNKYTFAKDTRTSNYYCSKRSMDCKARLKLSPDGIIIKSLLTHNHEPPRYMKSSTGEYIKL
jgi:hypothetical protein